MRKLSTCVVDYPFSWGAREKGGNFRFIDQRLADDSDKACLIIVGSEIDEARLLGVKEAQGHRMSWLEEEDE